MSLERLYTFVFENVTVAAVQDLLYYKASATNGAELRRLSLSASVVTGSRSALAAVRQPFRKCPRAMQ